MVTPRTSRCCRRQSLILAHVTCVGTTGVSPVLFTPEGGHASLYPTAGSAARANSGPEGPSPCARGPRGPGLHGWHSLPECPGTFLRARCGERGHTHEARGRASPYVGSGMACLGGAHLISSRDTVASMASVESWTARLIAGDVVAEPPQHTGAPLGSVRARGAERRTAHTAISHQEQAPMSIVRRTRLDHRCAARLLACAG